MNLLFSYVICSVLSLVACWFLTFFSIASPALVPTSNLYPHSIQLPALKTFSLIHPSPRPPLGACGCTASPAPSSHASPLSPATPPPPTPVTRPTLWPPTPPPSPPCFGFSLGPLRPFSARSQFVSMLFVCLFVESHSCPPSLHPGTEGFQLTWGGVSVRMSRPDLTTCADPSTPCATTPTFDEDYDMNKTIYKQKHNHHESWFMIHHHQMLALFDLQCKMCSKYIIQSLKYLWFSVSFQNFAQMCVKIYSEFVYFGSSILDFGRNLLL